MAGGAQGCIGLLKLGVDPLGFLAGLEGVFRQAQGGLAGGRNFLVGGLQVGDALPQFGIQPSLGVRGPLALGDVREEGVIVCRFALGIPRQVSEQFDGHARAVLPQVFLLIPDRLAGRVQFLQFLPLGLPPLGRREGVGPIHGPQFLGGVAGQLLESPVDQADTTIRIAHGECLRRVLDDAG